SEVLVVAQEPRQTAFHEGEWPLHHRACALDLLDRMRRLELHPVDAGLSLVDRHAVEAVLEAAVHRVARVALRHDDEVGIELVLHVDGRAIASNRLGDGDHVDAGSLSRPLAFDRLVIDAHAGDPGTDALAYHAAHRHHAAVAGVAVHHHREAHAVCDP